MKRAIIRFYWGIEDNSNRVLARKKRVDGNLTALIKNPFNTPFVNYIFGTDNYNHLKKLGFENLKLVCKEPYMFDLTTQQFRHKLEGLRLAMEDYDEILHLDYDCYPTQRIPFDIWAQLGRKESIQGNLQQYKKVKCPWRKIDQRKVLNGGAVYIRDKSIPDKIISLWSTMENKRSCEPAMSLYLDNLHGGWIGKEEFFRKHELEICNLSRNGVYGKHPNACFIHYAGTGTISQYLKDLGLL